MNCPHKIKISSDVFLCFNRYHLKNLNHQEGKMINLLFIQFLKVFSNVLGTVEKFIINIQLNIGNNT